MSRVTTLLLMSAFNTETWLSHREHNGTGEYSLERGVGNDSNLLIVFYVQIMPDDFVMQLHR
ncbi:hypothetical protein M8O31_22660, partial [Enterobacter kobei]